MKYTVYVRRSAELDVAKAQEWYEQQQPGLSHLFHDEFAATIEIISRTPLIYPKLYRNVRRAVLHRFPYLVWYRVEGLEITIVACTHGKANPLKTSQRLR
jgi:plasmid stabilization system protein ParE